MNPILTLLAAVALVAPAAAIGYAYFPDDPATPVGEAAAAAPSAGNLQIVLAHKGDDLDASLRVEAPGFVGDRAVTLRGGAPQVVWLDVPAGDVSVTLSSTSFTGSNAGDLRACDASGARFTFKTKSTDGLTPIQGSTGVAVRGPDCIGGPAVAIEPAPAPREERFTGSQTIGVAVAAPYPTCPLDCTVSYGFFGTGGFKFPVSEGATSIDVIARWTPTTPLTETLDVGLYVEDDSCGEGCWWGVAGAGGAREVRFTLDDPDAVTHKVSAHLAGAGAGARQDIEFEVVVHYS